MTGLDAHIARLSAHARSRGIGDPILSRAERATSSRFRGWADRPLTRAEVLRSAAYFEAVVRRAVLASDDAEARALRRRLVATSIEADLVAAGWDRDRAAEEAHRTLGVLGTGAVA